MHRILARKQLSDEVFMMTVEAPLESWHLPLLLLWTRTPLPDRHVLEVMASSLGALVDEQNHIEQQLASPEMTVDQDEDREDVFKVHELPALSLGNVIQVFSISMILLGFFSVLVRVFTSKVSENCREILKNLQES